MSKKGLKLGKNEKEVLRLIGMGLLVGAAFVAPSLPSAFKSQKKRYALRRSFQQVYDKNLIYLSGEGVHLSKKGQDILARIDSAEITIQKGAWDGIWRIVAYDIPDDKKSERDHFRNRLKSWGFEDLQKSMLVIPYECKEEIAVFAQNLGVSPYVMYLVTDSLPRQIDMIKRFALDQT